jgi:hypothetical protein
MKDERKEYSLGDRFITGVLSAIVMFLTLLVYFVLSVMIAPRGAQLVAAPIMYSFFNSFSFYAICFAFIVGFIIGPEKMADIFSIIWETHPFWKRECPKSVERLFSLGILAGAIYVIYWLKR